MSEFLLHYDPVPPTTWAYLASLLMVGLFFKFGRFWSVRNLDLALLITLAPGLLLVHFGEEKTKSDLAAAAGRPTDEVASVEGAAELADPEELTDQEDLDLPLVENGSAQVDLDTIVPNDGNQTVESLTEEPDTVADTATVEPAATDTATVGTTVETGAGEGEPSPADGEQPAITGRGLKAIGFIWLLSASGLLLVRLLLDQAMVRRPLLEPNLSTGGLTFIGCSLFVFLMANVVSSPVTEKDLRGPRSADQIIAGVAGDADEESSAEPTRDFDGPGNALLYLLPSFVTMPQMWSDGVERSEVGYLRMAKTMAILSHLAIVIGVVGIGYRHFGNIQTGIGAATLYLMLPYTSQMTGRVDHVLPAALIVWGILCYRRPLPAGMFIGLAIGVAYYPLFLLPLWVSFYWQRGLMRFVSGILSMVTLIAASMAFLSSDLSSFTAHIRRMFGIRWPVTDVAEGLTGIWSLSWDPSYRVPVLAAFVALSGALAIWPVQKNLGTLLSCSAAVMVATQFWHGDGGGLYMAWFLPLTLLTIFRPNLEDRVALSVLGAGWFPRRRHAASKRIDIAA